MQRNVATVALASGIATGSAFVVPRSSVEVGQGSNTATDVQQQPAQHLMSPTEPTNSSSWGVGGAIAAVSVGAVAARAVAGRSRKACGKSAKFVPLSSALAAPAPETYVRDHLVACRAQATSVEEGVVPTPEEADAQIDHLQAMVKQLFGGLAAGMILLTCGTEAHAYPIFAQQNYPDGEDESGKVVCANCHLAVKDIDVRMPMEVLADTIFKVTVEVPAKYDKRYQPVADGTKAKLNVGAVACMPEGWKLAPRDRLPKELKKQMKGLAWSAFSKEKPNVLVAGPVPGETYETMVLPILAPDPNQDKNVNFGKFTFNFGGNRGRGQVYPDGTQSNNNQFFASTSGTVQSIDGLKITWQKDDGSTVEQEVLPGADIQLQVGEKVKKGDPITTNPNVGGFGQAEKEVVLQDMNRVYTSMAFGTSIFLSQLAFVLKKKQFEKVQEAEGF